MILYVDKIVDKFGSYPQRLSNAHKASDVMNEPVALARGMAVDDRPWFPRGAKPGEWVHTSRVRQHDAVRDVRTAATTLVDAGHATPLRFMWRAVTTE